jgi:hypothetical protein
MFGLFGYIKVAILIISLIGIAGGITYVMKLRSDLAISEANNVKLEMAVGEQKAVIEQQIQDFAAIQIAMNEQQELNNQLSASIDDLRNKFHKINASGEERDIGNLAQQKPELMERAINRGTDNAFRCMEIAMGSPLTEEEENATKKSEINPECPDLANPAYVPYGN